MSGAAQRKGGKLSLLIANATGLEVRRSQKELHSGSGGCEVYSDVS